MLKNNVLRKNSDFNAIYKKGRSVGDRYLVLFLRETDCLITEQAFWQARKSETV